MNEWMDVTKKNHPSQKPTTGGEGWLIIRMPCACEQEKTYDAPASQPPLTVVFPFLLSYLRWCVSHHFSSFLSVTWLRRKRVIDLC